MKILIIEDEQRLARLLKQGFEEQSFVVDLAHDGEEGLHLAETYPYDAVILDLMLPFMNGLTILTTLRARQVSVPILIVTARGEIEDRIRGLDIGADDYIAKPFELAELIARVRSHIRRSKGQPSPLLTLHDLVIDTTERTVERAGTAIVLSAREYSLLECLALNAGKVMSRTELIDHVYATSAECDSNVIDVYINYLRNKLDRGFDRPLIQTVRGVGYVLHAEP